MERNKQEQDEEARPAIAGRLPTVDTYNTVLLGSPIWNVRPPMIMRTFVDNVDLRGKTIYPFVTYAVSGMGNTIDDYTRFCPDRRSEKVSPCAAKKPKTPETMCRRGYKTSDCSRGEARRNRMLLGHSTKPGSHRSIAVLASCTSSVPRCSDDSTRAATAEPRKIISPVANSSSTIARVSSMAPSQSPVRAFSFKFDVDHLARESS